MKKLFIPVCASAMLFLSGCAIQLGSSGTKTYNQKPTLGQQLVDLQKAKDAGVLNDAEFQAQKTKLLQNN